MGIFGYVSPVDRIRLWMQRKKLLRELDECAERQRLYREKMDQFLGLNAMFNDKLWKKREKYRKEAERRNGGMKQYP